MTVLNVALPTLATGLQASTSDLQWIVNSYTLILAAALLPAGMLGDPTSGWRSNWGGNTWSRNGLDLTGLEDSVADTMSQGVSAGVAMARQLNSDTLLSSVYRSFVHGMTSCYGPAHALL